MRRWIILMMWWHFVTDGRLVRMRRMLLMGWRMMVSLLEWRRCRRSGEGRGRSAGGTRRAPRAAALRLTTARWPRRHRNVLLTCERIRLSFEHIAVQDFTDYSNYY